MINKTKSKNFLCISLALLMFSSINLCCLANNPHTHRESYDAHSSDSVDAQPDTLCMSDQSDDEIQDELADQLPLTRQLARRDLLANSRKNKVKK